MKPMTLSFPVVGSRQAHFFTGTFLIDDKPAGMSVDRAVLNDGAVVTFAFERYVQEQHKDTLLEKKHQAQMK